MGRSLRILFIEDSERDAMLMTRTLNEGGLAHEFVRVSSAKAMEEIVAEGGWDAVLCDCETLPLGAQSALEIWKRAGRDVPFIVVSGAIGEEQAVALLKAGAADFIRKEHLTRLVPTLRRALEDAAGRARRRETEQSLRKFSTVVDQSPASVVITDTAGNIEYVNKKFTEISGYQPEEVLHRNPRMFKSGHTSQEEYQRLWETIVSGGEWHGEFLNRKRDGEFVWESAYISPIKGADGTITNYLAIKEDITETKEAAKRIWHQANFDELTGLPNRNLFMDRLGQALVKAARDRSMVALMYLDLDRFKYVNDTLGHDVGDELLKQAAQRLGYCVRESDTISRLGGDEFTIILPDMHDERSVIGIAQKILQTLSQVFIIDNREAYVGGSIGITLYPDDGVEPRNLLRNADTAMYRAKEAGRSTYRFFTQEMNAQAQERVGLENDLRISLKENRFSVLYQPIIRLSTGEVACMEALLRWNRPGYGETLPDRFIPVAEETGLIKPIGEWVLRTACRQAAAWTEPTLRDMRVSVNLSTAQCQSNFCPHTIQAVLEETALPGERLTLEITESLFIGGQLERSRTLEQLKAMGLRLAIDDFGTGYSSLSYLKRFPIDTLKIDRTFIQHISSDPDDRILCQAIIALGHTLNLVVVAEGVETEEQLACLLTWKCDLVQGLLFSEPLSPEGFEAFVMGETSNSRRVVQAAAGGCRVG